jgi:uncharacterized Tic20 family protein
MAEEPQTGTPPPVEGRLKEDEKAMAGLAHIAILFLAIILPLILWLMEKDKPNRSKYYIFQLKQALFWQIGYIVSFCTCVGWIVFLVFGIIAAVKCFQGEPYEYPVIGAWAKEQ